jgi:RNA polymerase sigma-70 factor, ECF subfamily
LTKSDDAALFELWLTKKDGDAFAELARRHAPVVYDLAARVLRDRTAAEDVVQEALLDLALEPTRKPAEVGVVAWLARFAICRARNQRSSERCRTRRQQIVGLRRPEEAMPDDRLELKEELDRALSAAEPDEQAVLAMRFLHGWEYDRIAQALETSEGAARVRVHRALSSVRSKLGADADEPKVARGMAALGIIPLSTAKLDASIRSALDAAGVPFAPSPAVPAGLRTVMLGFGAAVLLATAASLPSALESSYDAVSGEASVELASAASGAASKSVARPASIASARAASFGVPRPENWDGGALARLARGETSDVAPAAPSAPRTGEAPAATEEVAAEPVPTPAVTEPQQPSSAFGPSERGASAANCDPGSSDDGRADALGGFARYVAPEPVTERVVVEETAPPADFPDVVTDDRAEPGVRIVSRGRRIDALDASEKALVDEAAALVRDAVAQAADGDPSLDRETLSRVRRVGVRAVKHEVRRLHGEEVVAARPTASARKAAKLARVFSVLVDYAFSQGADVSGLRFPDGVDVASALEELIRVLSAAPLDAASRRPDIAADGTATDAPPADRLPELQ